MEILARAVGRRKEAVAQVQLVRGTGQFFINTKSANEYLQNDSCSILDVQAPFEIFKKNVKTSDHNNANASGLTTESTSSLNQIDTIVKVKGGGLKGQAEAIRLGIARALCLFDSTLTETKDNQKAEQSVLLLTSGTQNVGLRKQLKDKGYLTQDSRVKERRKYGLKKARKASQYHKR